MCKIASNPILSLSKPLPPSEEVFTCAGGIDTGFTKLGGGETEERVPGGDFGGVLAEGTAYEGEECGNVGDEGRGRWNWSLRNSG